MTDAVTETHLDIGPLRRGKVRDIYDLGETLLIVATDRISAFDVVMPTGIPDKGRVLTGLTLFWFEVFGETVPHHLIASDVAEYPSACAGHASLLAGRSMLVKKAEVVPVECVVRGYLAGSGWREYRETGTVCGVALPPGLKEADRLPEPIFTPTTKAESGHDEGLTFDEAADLVGSETAEMIRQASLAVYKRAAELALARGLIIADTKFEWGRSPFGPEPFGPELMAEGLMAEGPTAEGGGDLILVDEVLTPDSSRFWPVDEYAPGRSQPSFDKQYLRDWLAASGWDKAPPAPALPDEVVRQTRTRYVEAYERLTGRAFTVGSGDA